MAIKVQRLVFVIAATFFSIGNAELQCSVPGQCVDSDLIQSEIGGDKSACHNECKINQDCNWFTFDLDTNFCGLFSNCDNITEASCSSCVTSEKDCDVYQCSIQGSCQGHIDHRDEAESEVQCLSLCQGDPDCNWYTFIMDSSLCLLFKTCHSVDEDCSTCLSGERNCEIVEGLTKLLVATGDALYPQDEVSEIIDLSNPLGDCSDYLPYPGYEAGVQGTVGGLINGTTPFICGGSPYNADCYFLGDPDVKAVMLEPHVYAAAILTEDGASLWVTGGNEDPFIPTSKTEYVSPGKESVYGPDLPDSRLGHCLVQLDKETYMIIGGFSNDAKSSSYLFHVGNQTWTPGPYLSRPKGHITCQVLDTTDGTERIVVVAGGYQAPNTFNDIETWIVGSSGDFVKINAVLPYYLSGASSIVTSDKKSMVIIGGFDLNSHVSSLTKITCSSADNCTAEVMEQKLSVARRYAVAMLVPDSLANCD